MNNNILNNLEDLINSNQTVETDKLVEIISNSDNKYKVDIINLVEKDINIFSSIANMKDSKPFLVVVSNVVDIDDAYTNSLMFIMDNKHLRVYTLSEIIDVSSKFYRLISYKTLKEDIMSSTFENDSILEKGVLDVRDEIKDKVELKVDGFNFSLKVRRSIFIFEKV